MFPWRSERPPREPAALGISSKVRKGAAIAKHLSADRNPKFVWSVRAEKTEAEWTKLKHERRRLGSTPQSRNICRENRAFTVTSRQSLTFAFFRLNFRDGRKRTDSSNSGGGGGAFSLSTAGCVIARDNEITIRLTVAIY